MPAAAPSFLKLVLCRCVCVFVSLCVSVGLCLWVCVCVCVCFMLWLEFQVTQCLLQTCRASPKQLPDSYTLDSQELSLRAQFFMICKLTKQNTKCYLYYFRNLIHKSIYVVQMSLICTSHNKNIGQQWKPLIPKSLLNFQFHEWVDESSIQYLGLV